ncbi:hypothetical protein [Streptomyces sp. JH14]|uniref:hypothetical protein n=1 Tax=Streptomyces sp. JH14 TaxID=2793630 RepID=UPI003211DD10
MVTDHVTSAWRSDVHVDRSARGLGLGTRPAAVRDHLAPTGIRRLMLADDDAHGVHESVGFKPLRNPETCGSTPSDPSDPAPS